MANIETITSTANPRVKHYATLAVSKKARLESGLFIAEGLQLVGFGVEAGWELEAVVFRQGESHTVLNKALQAAHYAMAVNELVLEKLTRKDNPQGVIGVFKQQILPLEKVALGKDVWVVLEQVRDPGNLGTIIRTVDAVGAKGVIMVGTSTDVWSPETLRATMGSIFHVPVAMCSLESFLSWTERTGAVMVGTHLKGEVDYRQVADKRGDKALLLAMGTEQSGLSAEMTEACDLLTKIAMRGGADSLNLAIATGVMLYEVFRDQKPETRD